ncbi:cell division protein FtsQ/DivIB [Natronincola ferrireducens]|uniref:Cell division protein FtsQ n=1 Tax=Natronincola ferrireducens TaxID=393762 RepID=A0A1G9BMB3_9FIRM|nr:FtsQ-type POTRA domain-containing protein [Natronincola ferrireducens]SDK40669.1 cell division protein FtsQ [Natronincola ferrireducens]
MDYREIRREKKIRNRKVKRSITIVFFVIIFLLWGIYYLLQSDLLNLKELEVYGNHMITKEEILRTPELSIERNIFQYKPSHIKHQIELHPYVEEAHIKRKLPATIIITVKEREKYAIIPYMGSFIYIDHNKVVLEVSDDYLAEDLVLITGVAFNSFKIGDKLDISNEELLDRAMEYIEASKIVSIADIISEINIDQEGYIKLITFDGIEFLLSNREDPAYTILALKEVLTNLYATNKKNVIVDMRYKGQISIRSREQWEEDR